MDLPLVFEDRVTWRDRLRSAFLSLICGAAGVSLCVFGSMQALAIMAPPSTMDLIFGTLRLLYIPLLGAAAFYFFSAIFGAGKTWIIDNAGITFQSVSLFGESTKAASARQITIRVRSDISSDGPDQYYVQIRLGAGKWLHIRTYEDWSEAWAFKRAVEDILGLIPS
jgi:hypothetical protein